MSFTLVDHVEVGFTDGGTANGSTGHDVVLPGGAAAAAGAWDVIFVGSDTTVTTPSGFNVTQTFVNNQGGYLFTRKCTGGETATVRIKTTGDFSTVVLWSRSTGANVIDVSAQAHVDGNGAMTSPSVSTGTLASATDIVIVGSTNTDSDNTVPATPSWGAYTLIGSGTVGTGTALGWSSHAYKAVAGTAAETPAVTWTGSNMRNRYVFVVAFTATSGTDVVIQTNAGGAGAGSSRTTAAIDQVKQTVSGGDGAGSSRTTAAIDLVKQTNAGGDGAGSSSTTSAIGKTVQTNAGGAGAGSSATALTEDKIAQTVSGGAGAGSSRTAAAVDKVATSVSGGAGAGSSATSRPSAADVVVQTVSGGAGAGSSRTTQANSGVVQDQMVMPVLNNAMTCLSTEANKVPSPPAQYMIRPGASFIAMADQYADECCSGIGWVRPGPMWESDAFPEQRTGVSIDDPAYYAVQVELGLMRCVPTISDVAYNTDAKPTGEQWMAATQAAMDDAAALRRAICCLREVYGAQFVIAGPVTPLENEGNCSGTTVVLTMRVPACDCVE